ncbi:receptor-like serine/threonine-protein kinase SD1-8 [Wolffia australiana]
MGKPPTMLQLLFVGVLLLFISSASGVKDTLRSSEKISNGKSLVSANNKFTLGFFSPPNSNKTYLGIWFTVDPTKTTVWVANREIPLNENYFLGIDQSNRLFLFNGSDAIWVAGQRTESDVVLQLLDNGNLVLKSSHGAIIWQSFDYPTDTLLPEMKIGVNRRTGRVLNLTSWAGEDDPGQGPYSYSLDTRGVIQPLLAKQSSIIYRSGPWTGNGWSGNLRMSTFRNYTYSLIENQEEVFYQYNVTKSWTLARLVVGSSGELKRFEWDDKKKQWHMLWSNMNSKCDEFGTCRANGLCSVDGVPCKCFPGYKPKSKEEWDAQNWNGGCEKMTVNNCTGGDKFQPVYKIKLPDTVNAAKNDDLNVEECEKLCLKNCSCTAYAQAFQNESRCIFWTGDLTDSRTFSEGGQTLFVRVAPSEHVSPPSQETLNKSKKGLIIITTLSAALSLLTFILCAHFLWRKRFRKMKIGAEDGSGVQMADILLDKDSELPLLKFRVLLSATNNFAMRYKVGGGGFGDVFKAVLEDGQIVAVKKLSSMSRQRITEFATEVKLIARLQHRNLVRLLGCCIEGEERLLIYEYMANGSLDLFIFGDRRKRLLLDWKQRLKILLGVARGLLYLHQDSRLRVIHRDLKAANVLLDEEMNPKISDFGTARIFEREQMEHNTMTIVGTKGYMSPEYLMTGNFSEKSDIFSFGVLMLEVMSGRRNQMNSLTTPRMELLANAWSLWAENQCEVLLDSVLGRPAELSDVQRFIKVALLCVQECPESRPTMLQVVFMMANDTAEIPPPEKPGFFHPCNVTEASRWFTDVGDSSPSTDFTITCIEGR